MHKLYFFLTTCLILSFPVLGQKTDTTFYGNNKVRSIAIPEKNNPGNVHLIYYYEDGKLLMDGHFQKNVPNGDVTIYFSNGKIFQQYLQSPNVFNIYADNGRLREKYVQSPNDTILHYYLYYNNGGIYSENTYNNLSLKKLGLVKNNYSFSDIRLSLPVELYLTQTFYYPGGNKLHEITTNPPKHTFYNPDNTIDTGTYLTYPEKVYDVRFGHAAKNGTFREYYLSTSPKKLEHFINGFKEGEQIEWYPNGQMNSRLRYGKYEKREGWSETWYDTGTPLSSIHYTNNTQDGPQVKFENKNKTLSAQGSKWLDNLLGTMTMYDSAGNIQYEIITFPLSLSNITAFPLGSHPSDFYGKIPVWLSYEGDTIHRMKTGLWKAYYQNKQLCYSANYKDGYLDGPVSLYDSSGNKLVEANFTNGFANGRFISYFPKNDKPAKPAIYYEGSFNQNKINGLWNKYDSNGKIESSTLHLENESPLPIFKYEKGILIEETKIDSLRKIIFHNSYNKEGKLLFKRNKSFGSKYWNVTEYRLKDHLTKITFTIDDQKALFVDTLIFVNQTIIKHRTNNIYHGPYLVLDPKGNKITEGNYQDDYKAGTWISYDKQGNILSKKEFVKGIEQIENTASLECFCNKPAAALPVNSYAPFVCDQAELKDFNKLLKRFKFDSAYSYVMSWYEGDVRPLLPLYVEVDGRRGMRINLTPCMHGENETVFRVHHEYSHFLENYIGNSEEGEFPKTPFGWFYTLSLVTGVDENYKFYIRKAEELTGNREGIENFFKTQYNIDLKQNPPQKIQGLLKNYYKGRDLNSDEIFEKFLKKYFAKFILPTFVKKSMSEIFTDFYFKNHKGYTNLTFDFVKEAAAKGLIEVEANIDDIGIEFPAKLLRQVDRTLMPLVDKNGKSIPTELLLSVDELNYQNLPEEKIEIEREIDSSSFCFPTSEITGTGIIISKVNNIYVDFNALTFPEEFKEILSLRQNSEFNDHFKNFMGIGINKCNVLIPFKNNYMTLTGLGLLINGDEINGIIDIDAQAITDLGGEVSMKKYLTKSGLSIHDISKNIQGNNESNLGGIKVYFSVIRKR